jgi:nitrogen regulatory protein PII
MILIEAIIKPFKLDDLKEALEEIGGGGMTITEIMQTVPPRPKGRSFGATVLPTDLQPKMKVEIATSRRLMDRVIESVCLHGGSGKNEDGIITVVPLTGAMRIRTGEYDEDALS